MTSAALISTLRFMWANLTPEEQREIYETIVALRNASAAQAATKYKDPMIAAFAAALQPAGARPLPEPTIEI